MWQWRSDGFSDYRRTVGALMSLMQQNGNFHVVIKTRRNYPYHDGNVDIFIQSSDWASVRDCLEPTWEVPSLAVRIKQRMIQNE
jgi:hypothetical protein